MNIERYRMVMHRIWADLRCWDQRCWHGGTMDGISGFEGKHDCGTTHCVAGWAQVIAGRGGSPRDIARNWLGLTETEADWLFYYERTLDDLNAVLKRGKVLP